PVVPTAQAEVVVQANQVIPAVSPNQAAPVVPTAQAEVVIQANQVTPAVSPNQAAPVVPAAQAEVVIQANQVTPAVSPNQAAPVVPTAQAEVVVQANQVTPAVSPNQAAPVVPAAQAEVVIQANQVTPAVSPNQAAPAMPAVQAEVVVQANQVTPAVSPNQAAPAMPAAQAEVAAQANQVMLAVSPNQATPVAQAAAGQNPTNNTQLANNQAQDQVTANKITDEVVIQLRQTGTQTGVTSTTANSVQPLSAQDFFNKRAAQVSTSASQAMRGTPAADNIVMRLPSVLLQKLEQASTTSQTATTVSTEAISTSMTGASFKSMVQMQSLVGSGQTTVTSAEVPVAEGGSRLLSLLAADNPAQQAARSMQNQVGQQLQRMVRDGQWQANISLNPARLGQIRINMTMEDGVLKTQLLSANQGVRELLEGGIPRLRELLEESGLQLGQLDVASDAASQQFANQQSESGELSQVSMTASTEEENTEQRTSSHDGDLDTFA
ncbi:MAG: hypothetical protein GY918_03390, partial [Gammaproteobacteria bacterium]|nr:hypothetical protein [Gammaproteobacteria bacterium]